MMMIAIIIAEAIFKVLYVEMVLFKMASSVMMATQLMVMDAMRIVRLKLKDLFAETMLLKETRFVTVLILVEKRAPAKDLMMEA
jgi:hypothetical protein